MNSDSHELFTAKKAAARLCVSVKWLHFLVRSNQIECFQASVRKRYFSSEQIDAYLDRILRPLPQTIDQPYPDMISLSQKGGEKSSEDSRTDLGKEIRSLCRS